MAKTSRQKAPVADPFVGKSVRIKGECVVLAHYPAVTTAPDRLMLKVGDLTTVIPSAFVEVVR